MLAAGLADTDLTELGDHVVACWDEFLDVVTAPATDLGRPSRLPGWSGRDTCVHLARWDDHSVVDAVVASASDGAPQIPAGSPDAANARLVAAHADASDEEVVAAVRRARDDVAAFFASDSAAELGRTTSASTVGPLPVASVLHAGCYELAVHALDLAPCGAPPPAGHLLDRGLAALIDVTGALSARHDVHLTLTAQTPSGGWAYASSSDGWSTTPVPAGPYAGTGVSGTVEDLLDASAGRRALPQLLVQRRLVVSEMTSFMRLAPLLSEVPGLPGGAALRTAVAGLGGVSRLLGRLPSLRR
jgi:uncharacterized protein (TIGR03083 family)